MTGEGIVLRWPSRVLRLAARACLALGVVACGAEEKASLPVPTAEPVASGDLEVAIFAGGCFWCMQPPFRRLPGVTSTISGYTGGTTESPSYDDVSSGTTGHAEAVQVTYDPKQVSYEKLLEVFWANIDPLAKDSQFCDFGSQYRSAIFVRDENERKLAEASRDALAASGKLPGPIATTIEPAAKFYAAEEYHQDFDQKNVERYKQYVTGCGRKQRLEQLWGKSEG